MNKNKINPFYLILLIVAFYVFVFPLFIDGFSEKNILLEAEDRHSFNNGFTYYNSKGDILISENFEALPIPVGEVYTLSKTFMDGVCIDNSLGITMLHNAIRVYIDGNLIHENGYNEDGTFERIPRHYWDIISLPSDLMGKELTIEIMSPFKNYSGYIPTMLFGSNNLIVAELKNDNFSAFIISCLSFLTGIFIICLYFGLGKSRNKNRNFLYLGFSAIIIAMWLMAETDFFQFIISNNAFISSDSYFLLIMIPIPLILQIESSFKIHHNASYIYWLFVVYAAISIFLHIFNIIFIFETLKVFHLLSFLMIAYYTYSIIYEIAIRKNKDAMASLVEMGVLFLFGILELFNYYSFDRLEIGSYLRVGLLIFLVQSIITALKKLRSQFGKGLSTQHFKDLAYVDMLTGGKNRTAFENDLVRFSMPRASDLNTWLITLDANNLKAINDMLGHVVGDAYLERIYESVVASFKGNERVYRIGGDEFACIISNMTRSEIKVGVAELQYRVECFSEEHNTGVAVGYAMYDEERFSSVSEFLHYVDAKMYENKRVIKEKTSESNNEHNQD